MILVNRRNHKQAPDDSVPNCSHEQHPLLFDTRASFDAFQYNAGGDLGEFFGFDFIAASAVAAGGADIPVYLYVLSLALRHLAASVHANRSAARSPQPT
jgi:hypothetical protein